MQVFRDISPNAQGKFAAPITAIIIHGSRSERATSRRQEFDGTRSWAVTNDKGLAWHATIGEDMYSINLPLTQWGWHAGDISRSAIGIEFAQAHRTDDITDAQVRAFAAWYKNEMQYTWPKFRLSPDTMLMHSEVPQGIKDGKDDVFPRGDPRWADLKRRLLLAAAPEPDAFDAYALDNGLGPVQWRGMLTRKQHWTGLSQLPIARTDKAILGLTKQGVVDVTGWALSDWEQDQSANIARS